jgi:cytochrome o ubiquinol oxidase subunit 2
MNRNCKSFFFIIASFGSAILLSSCKIAIFDTRGIIASQEKELIIIATLLMLIVVIPVFILTFIFAWKYRASNTSAKYTPEWAHNAVLEAIWWTIPCIIIAILATITWISSHNLDPYKPLNVKTKPIIIEVIALDWKWLFIYPEQSIATVNYVQFPVNVPINFRITADAPMNSFWIPQLGGQIYSMAGMQTKLHLIADTLGDYNGISANFSGPGFSGMKFIARVSSENDFKQWLKSVKKLSNHLTLETYNKLAKPSENNPIQYYSSVQDDLYNSIIMKFMMPIDMQRMKNTQNMHNDSM